MPEKLAYYDVLGTLVPGVLLLSWVVVSFPETAEVLAVPSFPASFAVVALSVAAWFIGQVVQAIASLAEPLLYWSWGGRPSDLALKQGLGDYFPKDVATRIRKRLEDATSGTTEPDLFLFAMQRSEAAPGGRSSRFNALYAYHRSLLLMVIVALVLFLTSVWFGGAAEWTLGVRTRIALTFLALALLEWNRSRQRAYYYVREVLLTAERLMDQSNGARPGPEAR